MSSKRHTSDSLVIFRLIGTLKSSRKARNDRDQIHEQIRVSFISTLIYPRKPLTLRDHRRNALMPDRSLIHVKHFASKKPLFTRSFLTPCFADGTELSTGSQMPNHSGFGFFLHRKKPAVPARSSRENKPFFSRSAVPWPFQLRSRFLERRKVPESFKNTPNPSPAVPTRSSRSRSGLPIGAPERKDRNLRTDIVRTRGSEAGNKPATRNGRSI